MTRSTRGTTRRIRWSWLLVLACASGAPLSAQVFSQQDVPLLEGIAVAKLATDQLFQPDRSDVIALRVPTTDLVELDGTMVIQRQSQDGLFATAQVLNTRRARDFVMDDIDGDGDLDLLVAHDLAAAGLSVWRNLGQQGGPAGRFQRVEIDPSVELTQAVGVCSTGSVSFGRGVLLARGSGQPASYLELRSFPGSDQLFFSVRQQLSHPGAAGALCGDLNGDGRNDVLLYGDRTDLWLDDFNVQGPLAGPVPVLALSDLPPVLTATARDLNGDGLPELVLATSTGDLLLQHLGNDGDGIPQWIALGTLDGNSGSDGFGWFDADGDGQVDLIAARDNPDAPLAERGSRLLLRQGLNFTPDQRLAPARSIAAGDRAVPLGSALLLGSASAEHNGLWQAAGQLPPQPVLRFWVPPFDLRPNRYYLERRIGFELEVLPHAPADLRVSLVAVRISPQPAHKYLLSTDITQGVSRARRILRNQPTTPAPSEWILNVLGVLPSGLVQIGSPNSTPVFIFPNPFDSELTLKCYVACVLIGVCGQGTAAPQSEAGVGGFMGTLAEVQLLQRLRDERMASSAGGQHYIDRYEVLQLDLYAASFAEPRFYLQLWDLKDAWMPAVGSLVDGDGSSVITAEMVELLLQALLDLQAYGSDTLREAIEHERRALDLASLAGRPVIELQQRWERHPILADGFE